MTAITSIEARRHHETTGRMIANRARVHGGLIAFPGLTSAELARELGMDYHEVARRLPELRARGYATNGVPRQCRIRGKRALTWYPANEEDAA